MAQKLPIKLFFDIDLARSLDEDRTASERMGKKGTKR
jgi:hypothetical protein